MSLGQLNLTLSVAIPQVPEKTGTPGGIRTPAPQVRSLNRSTANPALADRVRKWVIPRYRRYLLFYIFEKGVRHLIDLVDGKRDYTVEDPP